MAIIGPWQVDTSLLSFLRVSSLLLIQPDCVLIFEPAQQHFCRYSLRRCLASRLRGSTCLPVSRYFILSFEHRNLRSGIFSCNTSSTFGVFFLVSVFLVSEDFPVSPKNNFGRHPVINFLFKTGASYDLAFESYAIDNIYIVYKRCEFMSASPAEEEQ